MARLRAGAGAAILLCGAALAQTPTACFAPGADPAAKIAACSATLRAGSLPKESRSLALAARADAYIALQNPKQALADLNEALALIPADIRALMTRGQLFEAAGEAANAEADYTAAIVADPAPRHPAASSVYTRRGALRITRGAVDAGIADLGEAKRFVPNDPQPYKIRGLHFLKQGDLDRALEELSGAIARDGRDPETLIARATTYARRKDLSSAIADFSTGLTIAPTHPQALEGRGVALLQNGDARAAVADFSALLAQDPNNIEAQFFRANARLQANDLTDADEDFSAVLAKRPGDAEARMGRATAHQFAGRYRDAENDLTAILDRDPKNTRAVATRGHVRFMAADFADATTDFTRAIAQPGTAPELALWHFAAEARGGGKSRAAPQGALSEWPGPLFRYFRGELSGDELLAAGAGDLGRLCETYFWLGQAALLVGDKAEATRLFRAALATGMRRYTEHAAATAELARLSP